MLDTPAIELCQALASGTLANDWIPHARAWHARTFNVVRTRPASFRDVGQNTWSEPTASEHRTLLRATCPSSHANQVVLAHACRQNLKVRQAAHTACLSEPCLAARRTVPHT